MGEVNLNVGGVLYTTTLQTLRKHPDSMFNRMFDEEWYTNSQPDKPTFIDQDGENFRYILGFLRHGPNLVLPSDKESLLRLRNDAQFYLLEDLMQLIDDKMKFKSITPNLNGGSIVRFHLDFVETFINRLPFDSKYLWEVKTTGEYSVGRCIICGNSDDPQTYKKTLLDEQDKAVILFKQFLLGTSFTVLDFPNATCCIVACLFFGDRYTRHIHAPRFAFELFSE